MGNINNDGLYKRKRSIQSSDSIVGNDSANTGEPTVTFFFEDILAFVRNNGSGGGGTPTDLPEVLFEKLVKLYRFDYNYKGDINTSDTEPTSPERYDAYIAEENGSYFSDPIIAKKYDILWYSDGFATDLDGGLVAEGWYADSFAFDLNKFLIDGDIEHNSTINRNASNAHNALAIDYSKPVGDGRNSVKNLDDFLDEDYLIALQKLIRLYDSQFVYQGVAFAGKNIYTPSPLATHCWIAGEDGVMLGVNVTKYDIIYWNQPTTSWVVERFAFDLDTFVDSKLNDITDKINDLEEANDEIIRSVAGLTGTSDDANRVRVEGSSTAITIPRTSATDVGEDNFSIIMKSVDSDLSADNIGLVSRIDGSDVGYEVYTDTSNLVVRLNGGGSEYKKLTPKSALTNTKHLVISVDKSDKVKVYADTVELAGSEVGFVDRPTISNTADTKVGVADTDKYLGGTVEEFRVVNTALTQSDVNSFYENNVPKRLLNGSNTDIANSDFTSDYSALPNTVVDSNVQFTTTSNGGISDDTYGDLEAGATYRITVDFNLTGAASSWTIYNNDTGSATNPIVSDTNEPVEFVANGNEGIVILIDDAGVLNGSFTITKVGELGRYTESNIGNAVWYDQTDKEVNATFSLKARENINGVKSAKVLEATKLLRVPRIDTATRDALAGLLGGEIIYNISTNKFQGYENGSWVNLI